MVAGEVVNSSKVLFVMADVSQLWIMLDVRAEDIGLASIYGQKVTFFPGAAGQEPVRGQVSWISTEADEKTRTVHVRAEVANPEGSLQGQHFRPRTDPGADQEKGDRRSR